MDIYLNSNIKNINLPKLIDNQYYIYVIENDIQHNIKIGITKNISQRIKNLSGSNSCGNPIIKCAISNPTYLYSLEKTLHNKYNKYRFKSTEWFDGNYIKFEDVINYIDDLFNSDSYINCNNTRKLFKLKNEKEII